MNGLNGGVITVWQWFQECGGSVIMRNIVFVLDKISYPSYPNGKFYKGIKQCRGRTNPIILQNLIVNEFLLKLELNGKTIWISK